MPARSRPCRANPATLRDAVDGLRGTVAHAEHRGQHAEASAHRSMTCFIARRLNRCSAVQAGVIQPLEATEHCRVYVNGDVRFHTFIKQGGRHGATGAEHLLAGAHHSCLGGGRCSR
jgi:hypothetical protein